MHSEKSFVHHNNLWFIQQSYTIRITSSFGRRNPCINEAIKYGCLKTLKRKRIDLIFFSSRMLSESVFCEIWFCDMWDIMGLEMAKINFYTIGSYVSLNNYPQILSQSKSESKVRVQSPIQSPIQKVQVNSPSLKSKV